MAVSRLREIVRPPTPSGCAHKSTVRHDMKRPAFGPIVLHGVWTESEHLQDRGVACLRESVAESTAAESPVFPTCRCAVQVDVVRIDLLVRGWRAPGYAIRVTTRV